LFKAVREHSPAIYGWEYGQSYFPSPVRDGRPFLSSLTGLVAIPNREPSHEWLGYFQSNFPFTYEAEAEGKTSETVIQKIFDELPVP
jgi:hypothetical protein